MKRCDCGRPIFGYLRRSRKAKSKSFNKICPYCTKKQYGEKYPARLFFNILKQHAKERGIDFKLDKPEFERFFNETGVAGKIGKKKGMFSLDRINPLEGYTLENIRFIKAEENSRKGATSDKETHQQNAGDPF